MEPSGVTATVHIGLPPGHKYRKGGTGLMEGSVYGKHVSLTELLEALIKTHGA